MKINQYIDHTLLKPTASSAQIVQLCEEAITHDFYAVCVNGSRVALAKKSVANSAVKVAAVIGFPLGAMGTESKVFEARKAIENGADEIDMVVNIGKVLDGELSAVQDEIFQIKQAVGDKVLKVIFENCYLEASHITALSEISLKAGADFIKTSTGFGTGGATLEDVYRMAAATNNGIAIKAAGGIRDLDTAKKYLALGVTRLGTSSGVALVTEGIAKKDSY